MILQNLASWLSLSAEVRQNIFEPTVIIDPSSWTVIALGGTADSAVGTSGIEWNDSGQGRVYRAIQVSDGENGTAAVDTTRGGLLPSSDQSSTSICF